MVRKWRGTGGKEGRGGTGEHANEPKEPGRTAKIKKGQEKLELSPGVRENSSHRKILKSYVCGQVENDKNRQNDLFKI